VTGRFPRIVAETASFGLFVIPVAVGEKVPLVKWKHLQSRLPSPDDTADWCARFPDANGAFVTGAIQQRVVVDIDSDSGSEYLEKRDVPETQLVRTRERRLHYHFRHPGFPVRNSAGEFYEHIDIRGDGGLATAPGSIGRTGYTYHWEPGHSPADIELASAPNWLIDWLFEQNQRRCVIQTVEPRPFAGKVGAWARTAIDRELEKLSASADGTRNASLTRVAFKLGQLAGGGEADAGELWTALEAVASTWKDEHSKSADTIARAFAQGQAHPRRRPLRNVVWVESADAKAVS
jgi:Bifunctional DNA primase/polymerase, N-terminal